MGGGGGFFSFVMPVVGAVIGSMIAPGVGTAIGASIGGTTGGVADGEDFDASLMQGAVSGAAGLTGGLVGTLAAGLMNASVAPARYSLPDLPSFKAGDGLDFLDQDPAETPDSAAVAEEAARKRALLLEEETGPADLVLTATSLAAERPEVGRKTLLGA